RERADDNWIAQLATYTRSLLKNLGQTVGDPQRRELRLQVGHHSTRHLMLVVKGVVLNDAADGLALASRNVRQALRNLTDGLQVERCAESRAPYVFDEPFGGRMGCAIGERGRGGMNHVNAKFHCATCAIWCQSRKTMRVKMQGRAAARCLERRD